MKKFQLNNRQNRTYDEAYTKYLNISEIYEIPKEEIYNYSEFFDEVFNMGLKMLFGIYKQGKIPRKHKKKKTNPSE